MNNSVRAHRSMLITLTMASLICSIYSGCENENLIQATARSRPVSDFSAEVATSWFNLTLKLVKESPGFSPPVASRAFGYAGVTLYEAVVPGIPTHQSLVGQLNSLSFLPACEPDKLYHWPTVANSAMAGIARRLFANASEPNKAAMTDLETQLANNFKATLDSAVFARSVARGKVVADAIFAWSALDGGHEGYFRNFPQDYNPPVGPGLWEPTPPAFSRALQPYWGNNRPFVLASGSACMPGAPPAYSEQPGSAFYNEALEVYNTLKNLTPEQRDIAFFWSDDPGVSATPPGHSISILTQVIQQEGYKLDIAAEAYAKIGMAVADAFIACWRTKYVYNLLRPITFIQKVIDSTWTASNYPLVTPPFPEYTSGHSVQSSASMQVLTDLFGNNFAFTDHTHDARGLAPRSFSSFFQAAGEAGISRLYGGIHFRSAIIVGVEQGKCIGEKISALTFRK